MESFLASAPADCQCRSQTYTNANGWILHFVCQHWLWTNKSMSDCGSPCMKECLCVCVFMQFGSEVVTNRTEETLGGWVCRTFMRILTHTHTTSDIHVVLQVQKQDTTATQQTAVRQNVTWSAGVFVFVIASRLPGAICWHACARRTISHCQGENTVRTRNGTNQ